MNPFVTNPFVLLAAALYSEALLVGEQTQSIGLSIGEMVSAMFAGLIDLVVEAVTSIFE